MLSFQPVAFTATLPELLRTKKKRFGVINPWMFSRRASRLCSCFMKGSGSLNHAADAEVTGSGVAVKIEVGDGLPEQTASTADAPPAASSCRKRRLPMP